MGELLAGYERAERLGGVYSLRSDAHWRAAKGRELLYTRVGDELRARGAWFAEPAELADWWSARAGVRAELDVVARDRVRVRFANPGTAEARGVTARVYLPHGADTARLVAGPMLRSAPLLRISADHTWVEIVERSLDPGAEVSYTSASEGADHGEPAALGRRPRAAALRRRLTGARRARRSRAARRARARARVAEKSAAPTWSGVVEPLERIGDRLATPWGVVGHLLGVKNSPALRNAHEAVQPDVVRFGLRVAQSKPLFDALVALEKSAESRASTPRSGASSRS